MLHELNGQCTQASCGPLLHPHYAQTFGFFFCWMPFIKKLKSDAYFSRFQVKYRRRREGKTNCEENKYNVPKYRLVVRFTNKDIIGDFVLVQAHSRELPHYGINHGLTNWAAAYATGLLCACRALTKLGLADKYEAIIEPDGNLKITEVLDVGLRRTSTGSHELDAEVLKKYIYGGHVAEYMESLEEEDNERFKKQFASYLADGDPTFKLTEKTKDWKSESVKHRSKRLTYSERKQNIATKIEKFKAGGDAAEDDDDNE
ncbi:hypothetical protein C8R45DRAFT_1138335 [Mycena sanguinolenta]|nr:hypothetical protein C8R45DRAFT_1138335 [Mycena sanguinolenta]